MTRAAIHMSAIVPNPAATKLTTGARRCTSEARGSLTGTPRLERQRLSVPGGWTTHFVGRINAQESTVT